MHSQIIQLEKSVITKENEMTDWSYDLDQFPSFCTINYVGDKYSDKNRKEVIKFFLSILPEGMFSYNEKEESITYVKKPTDYFENWKNEIQELSKQLTTENFSSLSYKIESTIEKRNCDILIAESDYFGHPVYICEFLSSIIDYYELGEKFYFGSVLDYHY